MILSKEIAGLLEKMLEEGGGELSIVRNELALRLGCVPSQINYVISSRFTPERGYLVESRRGGGGFIRIRKIPMGKDEFLMRFFHAAGESLDLESARFFLSELCSAGILTVREARLLLSAFSDRALEQVERSGRDFLRARIFRNMILELLANKEEAK